MRTTAFAIAFAIGAACLSLAVPALAQAPKSAPPGKQAAPSNTSPAAVKPDLPAPPPNYEYAPEGRRDPFVSLIKRGSDGKDAGAAATRRAEGVPGLLTSELTVRGILFTRGQYVAMVTGPDRKMYTVKAGDKLADGVIRSITANSVVILQEVHDPLSLEKQREVRKLLRGGEEVK
jgi:Tfp pilus assembly protein PilP